MTSHPRRLLVGIAVAALIACTGCGEKEVTIKGRLLKGGQPMVVSEDTYVTISFVPESPGAAEGGPTTRSATFDPKTGTYTVDLSPGKYRTMVVIALPPKKEAKAGAGPPKLNAPSPPVRSDKVYELTKSQELDIEVPR